MQGNA
jgi:hypothetical protein